MTDEIDTGSMGDLTCASHSAISRLSDSLASTRRRYERWPDEERDRILAESFTPGRTVAQVARDNGVGLGLLHYWRRQARTAGVVEELRLVPVTFVSEEEQTSQTAGMELIVRHVTVRIRGAIEADHLRTVLAAIRA